jgi:hypothetical protein
LRYDCWETQEACWNTCQKADAASHVCNHTWWDDEAPMNLRLPKYVSAGESCSNLWELISITWDKVMCEKMELYTYGHTYQFFSWVPSRCTNISWRVHISTWHSKPLTGYMATISNDTILTVAKWAWDDGDTSMTSITRKSLLVTIFVSTVSLTILTMAWLLKLSLALSFVNCGIGVGQSVSNDSYTVDTAVEGSLHDKASQMQ